MGKRTVPLGGLLAWRRLIEVLAEHTLGPISEQYGSFQSWTRGAPGEPDRRHFWGNFLDLAHVFDVVVLDRTRWCAIWRAQSTRSGGHRST